MSTTWLLARQGISAETGQLLTGTTSGNGGAAGATLVDTTLLDYDITDDDQLVKDHYSLVTSGTYKGNWRMISSFVASTGTITPRRAYGGQILAAVTHEIHPFSPARMLACFNKAIKRTQYLFKEIRDITTTETVADTYQYSTPTTIIGEPLEIWLEENTSDADAPYSRLMDWEWDEANKKVCFNYVLPAERIIKWIGKGYLTTITALTADTETVEANEPDIRHLYYLTLSYLFEEKASPTIISPASFETLMMQRNHYAKLAEESGRELTVDLPQATLKRAGWKYSGVMY
jgi:hypothetical protein